MLWTVNKFPEENFTLRGVLLWTVIDFPGYSNLSGYCVNGYKACQICSENTHAIRLTQYSNETYIGHRRFLNDDHPFHK